MRERDTQAAEEVIADDARVDALDQAVQEQTVKLLALRQPMANDLRVVLSLDQDRGGARAHRRLRQEHRQARHRADPGHRRRRRRWPASIGWAGWCATALKDVLDAFADDDVEKAHDVWNRDEEIDQVYTGLFRELLTYMMEDPRTITACTHLLFMAKNIERAGDHVTNIAELVSFRSTGQSFAEARRKGCGALYSTDVAS